MKLKTTSNMSLFFNSSIDDSGSDCHDLSFIDDEINNSRNSTIKIPNPKKIETEQFQARYKNLFTTSKLTKIPFHSDTDRVDTDSDLIARSKTPVTWVTFYEKFFITVFPNTTDNSLYNKDFISHKEIEIRMQAIINNKRAKNITEIDTHLDDDLLKIESENFIPILINKFNFDDYRKTKLNRKNDINKSLELMDLEEKKLNKTQSSFFRKRCSVQVGTTSKKEKFENLTSKSILSTNTGNTNSRSSIKNKAEVSLFGKKFFKKSLDEPNTDKADYSRRKSGKTQTVIESNLPTMRIKLSKKILNLNYEKLDTVEEISPTKVITPKKTTTYFNPDFSDKKIFIKNSPGLENHPPVIMITFPNANSQTIDSAINDMPNVSNLSIKSGIQNILGDFNFIRTFLSNSSAHTNDGITDLQKDVKSYEKEFHKFRKNFQSLQLFNVESAKKNIFREKYHFLNFHEQYKEALNIAKSTRKLNRKENLDNYLNRIDKAVKHLIIRKIKEAV